MGGRFDSRLSQFFSKHHLNRFGHLVEVEDSKNRDRSFACKYKCLFCKS